MELEDYGFRTGKVVLPGLDLVVELNKNKYFKNDGTVKNINEHTDKFLNELGLKYDFQRDNVSYGRQIYLGNENVGASLVFIKGSDLISNRFNYGHESTHAVISLGIENQFLDYLKKEGFTLNPFDNYDDEESIAHVGGIMGLYKLGMHDFFSHPVVDSIKEDLMRSKR